MRRFEFSDSTSNKFWEVDVKGKTLNVTFGKIGTKGQSKPKDFATPEKAKAEMEKLIKEKTGKGYVEVGGKAATKAVKEKKSAKAKELDADILGKGIKVEMVLIPAGKFKMGSPTKEECRNDDEIQHEVTLTKSFYIGKYAVTQEQWKAVMGDNPSDTKGAKVPVTDVSWGDCQKFIKKLNTNTDGGYRLPTEAEWEYACRSGTTTAYSIGKEISSCDANYGEDSDIEYPVEVGNYNPNAFGLYDMHGNVWEWCEDWYGKYSAKAVTDPIGPSKGEGRVCRGGPFFSYGQCARSSTRNKEAPIDCFSLIGFRLARTI
jgi:formylglycine-generating enzyme required for sulfatase activity